MPNETLCRTCGTTARQPGVNGKVLHTFALNEPVRSTAGMRGVIVAVPANSRMAKAVGYKVRWENGSTGNHRAPDLDHDNEENR